MNPVARLYWNLLDRWESRKIRRSLVAWFEHLAKCDGC